MAKITLKAFLMSKKFDLTFYHKSFFYVIFTVCSLSISSTHGTEVKEKENFESYMLFHSIKGCPTNSMCNKELGKLRGPWLDLLKEKANKTKSIKDLEQFKKNKGIQFNVWLLGELKKMDESGKNLELAGELSDEVDFPIAYWDSPCEVHRKFSPSIHPAQTFVKDLSPDSIMKAMKNSKDKIFFQKAYLFSKDNKTNKNLFKVKEFFVPRGEFPLSLNMDELHFVGEEDGHFYYFSIHSNGDITFAEGAKVIVENSPLGCPEEISMEVNKRTMTKETNPFPSTLCRQYLLPQGAVILAMPTGCY